MGLSAALGLKVRGVGCDLDFQVGGWFRLEDKLGVKIKHERVADMSQRLAC